MIRLIGITDEATAARVTANAADPALQGLTLVLGNGLAAVLAPQFKAGWFDGTRTTLIRRLGEDQKRLEAIHAFGPLLPAVNEAVIETHADAEDLLLGSGDLLRETLQAYGTKVQFQIGIDWKPEVMLKLHAGDAELADLMQKSGTDRASRGAALVAFIASLRKRLADGFAQTIAAAALETALLPTSGETGVVNIVALIDRADEALLDRAVEAIDAALPNALSIRYTGPLPPVSFAGLDVRKTSAGDLIAARHLLGLDERSPTALIREAYVAQARAIHPDTAVASASIDAAGAHAPANLAALKDAYVLLSRVATKTTSNGRLPPQVSIRREGEVARRA
jgi:hypothetical protein